MNKFIGILLLALLSISGCGDPALKGKKVAPVYTNSLGMAFVKIPGGTFSMGSEKAIVEKPVHKVTLSSFYMMTTEVTNEQFENFRKLARSKYSPDAKTPVMSAWRKDVIAFIAWLSETDGKTYLLPTEAQWEYAARGGLENTDYSWGNSWRDNMANIGGAEKPGGAKAKPVGSYPPNGFGLYDMCGNAMEMVRERHYNYTSSPKVDPVGPVNEPDLENPYICRGNGVDAFYPQVWMRSLRFDHLPPDTEGFRLIVLLEEKK